MENENEIIAEEAVVPAAEVAPDAPAEAPVDAPAEEPAVEAPAEELAAEDKPAHIEALEALGAELVKDVDGESVADAVEAPAVAPEAEEVVEPVEVPAETAIETSGELIAAAPGDETADTAAIAEVAEIAKSALDAALAAQSEVAALKKSFTEVLAAKAKVELELEKTLDLVGRLIDVPVGHIPAIKRATGEMEKSAPWLSPYIQRVLETQE